MMEDFVSRLAGLASGGRQLVAIAGPPGSGHHSCRAG